MKGGESKQALSGGGRTEQLTYSSHPRRGERKGEAVMKRILGYLKDERGIETLEWIGVGALILGVAFVVYPGTLQPALVTVVNNIGTALSGITIAP